MRFLPLASFKHRLILVIMLTCTVALVLACGASLLYEFLTSRRAIARDLTTQTEIVGADTAAALAAHDAGTARHILSSLHARPEIIYACLYDAGERVFVEYLSKGKVKPSFGKLPEPGHRFEGSRLVMLRKVVQGGDTVGTICLIASLDQEYARLRSYAVIVLGVMLAALSVSLFLSAWLQRILSAPLLTLSNVAREVSEKKDYSIRAPKQSEDELGRLTEGFNQMLEQIQNRDEALRGSEARFRQIAESIREVFWMTDIAKEQMIYISPAYETVWGRTCESLYANPHSWLDAIHPDDRERIRRMAITTQASGNYDVEYRIVRPDGPLRWIRDRAFPIRDKAGHTIRIVGIAEDITDHKLAAAALRESEERLKAILDNSPTFIYLKDCEGRYLLLNRWFESQFDASPHRLIGRTDHDFFPKENADTFRLHDQKVLQAARPLEFEEVVVREDGPHTYISTKFPLFDSSGKPYAVCGISTDITERRRLEKQILEISDREQQRIGQDLHDGLCQHLAATAYSANLLGAKLKAKDLDEASAADEIATLIDQSISQARTLARGLHPVNLESDGLVSALQELVFSTESLWGIPCRFEGDSSVTIADAPVATHLYRITQEAIANSIKHGKPNHIVVRLSLRDGTVTLTVADDGIGIADEPENQDGMGLHIMHYRARIIGASLNIERGPDHGTVVTCSFRGRSLTGVRANPSPAPASSTPQAS